MKWNRFGNMTPPEEMMRRSYLLAEKPFCIYGNLYFVGNSWCSSHLIDTGEGLILLDTPCLHELAYLIHNIYSLGFRLEDLRYIVVSHAHHDHYGAVRALAHLTGAKTFISKIDGEDLRLHPERLAERNEVNHRVDEDFEPDVLLRDEDVIRLGNTEIQCILTPGHTIGTMSHFWKAYSGEDSKNVGIYGGAGFVTVSEKALKASGLPLQLQKTFEESINKVWDRQVDIMLGNHPFHNDTFEKYERMLQEDGNPFIDQAEWQRYLGELKKCYHDFLTMTPEQIERAYAESGFLAYRDTAVPCLTGTAALSDR